MKVIALVLPAMMPSTDAAQLRGKADANLNQQDLNQQDCQTQIGTGCMKVVKDKYFYVQLKSTADKQEYTIQTQKRQVTAHGYKAYSNISTLTQKSKNPKNWKHVTSGTDFLKLISPDNQRLTFTYVVTMNNLLIFMPNSREAQPGNDPHKLTTKLLDFHQDLKSKHMHLSGGAPSVRYAGTLRFLQCGKKSVRMALDNNSGSYRPDGKQIGQVVKQVRNTLPKLVVEGLDITKPETPSSKELQKKCAGPKEVEGGVWKWKKLA